MPQDARRDPNFVFERPSYGNINEYGKKSSLKNPASTRTMMVDPNKQKNVVFQGDDYYPADMTMSRQEAIRQRYNDDPDENFQIGDERAKIEHE